MKPKQLNFHLKPEDHVRLVAVAALAGVPPTTWARLGLLTLIEDAEREARRPDDRRIPTPEQKVAAE